MGTRANQVLEGADFDPEIINHYLGSSFGIMQRCGEAVYKPFMQVSNLHMLCMHAGQASPFWPQNKTQSLVPGGKCRPLQGLLRPGRHACMHISAPAGCSVVHVRRPQPPEWDTYMLLHADGSSVHAAAPLQDYLQAGTLSRIVGGQIASEPGKLARMTLFMRSAQAGSMFAGSFLGILWYDFLYRLSGSVAPAHEALLRPFPGLLFRWRCLVSISSPQMRVQVHHTQALSRQHVPAQLLGLRFRAHVSHARRLTPSSLGARTTMQSTMYHRMRTCCTLQIDFAT